jgi:TRAP-type mannitol/chloroaromatic compound transport system permease small subunit
VKFLIPLGFTLIALQGLSELVKRIALLLGYQTDVMTHYERPVQ